MVAVGRKGGRTTVHVTEFDQFRNFQSRHARSATVGLAASQVGTVGKFNCPAHNDPLQDLTQYSGTTKLLVTHKKLAVSGVKWTLVRRINKHVSKCGIARRAVSRCTRWASNRIPSLSRLVSTEPSQLTESRH